MRSPANRRTRSSSADRKKRVSPGSPWRPARPRSWLSIRRDSWRSVPRMNRPPASSTSSRAASTRRSISGSTRCVVLVVVGVARLQPELAQLERARCSALPPSLMSTPRPAMLVAIVTAPGAPASAIDLALALGVLGLGVEHRVLDAPAASAAADSSSETSTEIVPDEHRLAALRGAPRSPWRPRSTCRPWSCRPDRCDPRGPSARWSGSGRPAARRSS